VRKNRNGLKTAIQTFARRNKNCHIFLTSRIAGYERLVIGANEWELVSFTPEQIKSFAEVFFESLPGHEDKAAKLHTSLQNNPRVMALAGIPLLLALLCRLFAEQAVLPSRRVEIYDKTLGGLLWDWRRDKDDQENDPTDEEFSFEDKKEILSQLSLQLFLESSRVDAWKLNELEKRIRTIPGTPRSKKKAQRLVAQLIRDGVLVRESEKPGSLVRFIHLTFHEYLAASGLAAIINDNDWQAKMSIGPQKYSVQQVLDKKAWDANWQEVISLLAGKLDNPNKLLELLHKREANDLLGHRLSVAGACLSELAESRRARLPQQIAREILDRWWTQLDQYGRRFPHIEPRLPIAASISETVLGMLCERLRDKDRSVRSRAAEALGNMGESAAKHPGVFDALLHLVEDKEPGVRSSAAEALGNMGQAAANHPNVIDGLVALLRDKEWTVHLPVRNALGKIGQATAKNSTLIDALISLLRDDEWEVRYYASVIRVFPASLND